MLFTLLLSGIMIVYMAITNGLSPPHVGSRYTIAINGQYTYEYFCETKQPVLDWVLYAYEALILVLCCKVCYDTRNVPDAINEAPSVAKIVFSVIILVLVVFTINIGSSTPEFVKRLISGVAFFVYNLSLFVFYFGYKSYLLLNGADLNHKMQVVWPEKNKAAGLGENKVVPTAGSYEERIVISVCWVYMKLVEHIIKKCSE